MGTKADLVRDLANGRVAHGTGCIGKSADDEPIFVICARDPLGALIVRAWATGAIRIAEAMDAWQIAHPNQIKVAD
jgi:hypothetical protein